MAAMSDDLEQKLLDFLLNAGGNLTLGTAPTSVYLALFPTATPVTDANGGTELAVENGYARATLTGAFDTMVANTSGFTQNTGEISFSQCTGSNWGEVTTIGIYDASTAGNLMFHGSLTTAKTVNVNDTFKIAAGDLVIKIDVD